MHRLEDFAGSLNRLGLYGDAVIVGAQHGGLPLRAPAGWRGPPVTVPPGGAGPAAAGYADGSLDFVYLDDNPAYPAVRDALRLWWPKVRAGGVLAGGAYLDGVLGAGADPAGWTVYGVRSAVEEFAEAHGLIVRVTLDERAAWFVVKPGRFSPSATEPSPQPSPIRMGEGEKAPAPRPRIGVLTAYDAAQRDIAAISVPNKRRYCERRGYELIEQTDGFDPARVPAWGKILFLKQHLPRFDWLFWSDADSLVMDGSVPLERFTADDSGTGRDGCDVVIAVEDMGVGVSNVNAGQILVRNCEWSKEFLDEVWAQTQFLADPLQEQRAIIHLLYKYDLSEHVRLVRQRSFNSYLSNYRRGDFLLHFPDMPPERRLRAMRHYEQFAEP